MLKELLVLSFTEEEADKLLAVLEEAQDEGPVGSGWKSEKLVKLLSKIEEAIDHEKMFGVWRKKGEK